MSILLPFDSVRPFLDESPLLQLTQVDTKNVYDAVIEIMSLWDKRSKEQVPLVPKPVPRCTHCKIGYLVNNEVDADCVCSNCGVVQASRLIIENNCQTYNERHDDMIRYKRSVPKDVPKWVQQSLDMQGNEMQRFEVENELEKWNSNPYAQHQWLTKDSLDKAKDDAMIPQRANATVRAVAAMLTPKIYAFFDFNDIKTRISKGMPLPVVRYQPPVAKYKCFKCGAPVFEPYMQRKHPCGWGRKRRRL